MHLDPRPLAQFLRQGRQTIGAPGRQDEGDRLLRQRPCEIGAQPGGRAGNQDGVGHRGLPARRPLSVQPAAGESCP